MSRNLDAVIGWVLALSLLAPAGLAAGTGDDLIAAAQRQDTAAVEKLLDEGVDVNSKSRYGATALFFACDGGNLEMVELLLEKGAEVDVTDTFYQANPLSWTVFNLEKGPSYLQIVLLLLEKGAPGADMALSFGVRNDNLELVKAAVEKGGAGADAIFAGLENAESAGKERIAEYLRGKAPAEAPEKDVELTAEQLAAFAGDYKNDDIGMQAKVFLEGEVLKLQAVGQPALGLKATGETTFTAREVEGIDLAFRGRGGLIEGFQLKQAGQEFYFPRIEADDGSAAEEVAEGELPPLPKAERTAPIHWPRFRGPNASGIGDGQGVPTHWNAETGDGVRWKTKIPGLSHASPVIWGTKIFIATAVSDGGNEDLRTGLYGDVDSVKDDATYSWRVVALAKENGEILWQKTASTGKPKLERHLKASHANPTPATDGRHLVVSFASEGLFCYDLDGNLIWKKDLGLLSSGWFYNASYEWGFSSSPILHDGKVIVQIDIQKGSFIAAYDVATGKELWKTHRDEIPTWGTPAVLPAGEGAEIVTNGTTIRGYDAATGAELWRLAPNSEITVASPVVADGLAYVTGGYPPARPIYAIRPGGRGDLSLPEGESSSAHIQWSAERGGTYLPTPVAYRGILYVLQNNGRLATYDAATGEQIYRERVGQTAGYTGSPVAADGKLYVTTEEGTTYVVRTGKTYQLLATNELDEVVMTSPAISDGLLVIRGAKHVYALEASPAGEASGTAGGAR